MKIEHREVDEERGIVQITTTDERWYTVNDKFVPSVTWICEFYPKGVAFYKWLANHGWDEAEALKIAAGDKGSRIHWATGDLLEGKEIKMDSVYHNPATDRPEELTVAEYEAVISFADWYKEAKPEIVAREFVVVNDLEGYAGTVDILCWIKDKKSKEDELWFIDIKSSPNIWPSHELQISAYSHAPNRFIKTEDREVCRLAILQVGYRRNKRRWKFTEVDDHYDEFLAAKVIWANETKGVQPKQKDYPLSVKLEGLK